MSRTEDELHALVWKAKEGNNQAFEIIIKELECDLKKLSKQFYINGAEEEDTYQEACIGVWKAVEDWKEDGGAKFRHFASMCCKRHIITVISTANRNKNNPLNRSWSLDEPIMGHDGDSEQFLVDYIPSNDALTLENYIANEEHSALTNKIKDKLTGLEYKIFIEYMKGQTYQEIAGILLIKTKAVDNALMRIRKKASGLLFPEEKN